MALVIAGALVAGFVNGLSGTGYALVSLGFWLHAMSPLTAAPLVAFCSVCGHLQSLPRIWQGVIWSRLWPFMVGGLIGVPLGTAMLAHVQVGPLKIGVGLLLIFYCSWMAFVRRPPVVLGGGRLADATAGLGGGVLGGMASISGPIPVIWVQLRGWTMLAQRGVNQPYNMSVLAFSLVTAAIAGFLDRTFFVWAAITLPVTLIGAHIGLRLYGRIDDAQFRRLILGLLGLSGLTLIGTSLS
ncbi:MAG: sulfite exporter TauE/SafE family protein [Alphaproteobacteria bacterium]|nr:MAG: sulfite exporter TauE/SafE family protein [Alphaproteobacteria bacterium]